MTSTNSPVSQTDAAVSGARWTQDGQPKIDLLKRAELQIDDEIEQLLFISDMHGLYQPLQAFERERRRFKTPTQLVFVGDHCHRGPNAAKVLGWLHGNVGSAAVMGNHDEDMFTPAAGVEPVYTAGGAYQRYSDEEREYVRHWPHRLAITWRGKNIVVWHGHVNAQAQPCSWLSPPSRQAGLFPEPEADLVVLGHTHYAYVLQEGRTIYANTGSMGWTIVGTMDEADCITTQSGKSALGPQDDVRSSYLVVRHASQGLNVKIARFIEDREAALRDMEQAGLPNMDRFRGWFRDGLMNRPTGADHKLRWNR